MAFFEDFTAVLKQKWLQYYQDNKHWLVLHMKTAAVKTPDGGTRPPAYFILGVMSTLEPKLAQLMLPFSQLNPDADRLIEVLGLNFNPESDDPITTTDRVSDEPPAQAPDEMPVSDRTIETAIAVPEAIEESAPVAAVQEESEAEANLGMEYTAASVAAVTLAAEAFDEEEEADPLKSDVWEDESESVYRESAADDDLGDMGLDALEQESADDDDLGDMALEGLEDDSSDDDDDLGDMDLGGLGEESIGDDDDLGDLDLGGLGEESTGDDDLGDLDLGSLDDDSDDDGLDGLDLDGLGDDSDDDGLDGLDLDDLGGKNDDDTSDLLKGL